MATKSKAWLSAMGAIAVVAISILTFAFKAEDKDNNKRVDMYWFEVDQTGSNIGNYAGADQAGIPEICNFETGTDFCALGFEEEDVLFDIDGTTVLGVLPAVADDPQAFKDDQRYKPETK